MRWGQFPSEVFSGCNQISKSKVKGNDGSIVVIEVIKVRLYEASGMNDDDVMLTLQISSCTIVTNTSHLFAARLHSFCPLSGPHIHSEPALCRTKYQ
jgi:hypothetical protein